MSIVADVAARLAAAGVEEPRVDAEWLVAHVLGVRRSDVAFGHVRLADDAAAQLESLVCRRERREPLQYVLGEWGFRRLTLTVDRRALIPRPETETVVERALALIGHVARPRVLDLGTGSGAIALALADELPAARVTGIDVSAEALALAHENAARTGLSATFTCADFSAALPAGPWDLIVSNPPYVLPGERASLQPEVREWEPEEALFGVGVGEGLAALARPALTRGGALVLECGEGQADQLATRLVELGYVDVSITPDLAGRPRVVEGRVDER
jgi:release factor glutamine methyltransferase